ncbi:hypothetical protein GCM10010347_63230 [Streptomyces cirratus]|uniref:PAC domain-containing protein n=1 Tax=Streptomyces cirratus TaxID=68187 RepID=A0ABQ3F538_9ACTN|nr:PAS domain S-box protein [Streptomyces cirratus]GHB83705.1 hypothetical protein GCM10010347_63230 [Streptomyces cirratus]
MTGSHPADQDPADRNPAENPVGRFGALAPAETAFTLELEAALADGPLEDEGWRIRKDGSRFWVNVVITPLFDGAWTLLGFGMVTRDLTERRAAEQALTERRRRRRRLPTSRRGPS